MSNIIGVAALIALASSLVWLSIRAWRLKNGFLRWGSVGLSALFAAAVFSASLLVATGLAKMHMRSAPVQNLHVARTPEKIERGRAIADSYCGA